MARESLFTVGIRLLRAVAVFLLHVAISVPFMAGLWAHDWAYRIFFHESAPKLFDVLPVKWIFDAGMLGPLVVLLWFGIYEFVKQLRA